MFTGVFFRSLFSGVFQECVFRVGFRIFLLEESVFLEDDFGRSVFRVLLQRLFGVYSVCCPFLLHLILVCCLHRILCHVNMEFCQVLSLVLLIQKDFTQSLFRAYSERARIECIEKNSLFVELIDNHCFSWILEGMNSVNPSFCLVCHTLVPVSLQTVFQLFWK